MCLPSSGFVGIAKLEALTGDGNDTKGGVVVWYGAARSHSNGWVGYVLVVVDVLFVHIFVLYHT